VSIPLSGWFQREDIDFFYQQAGRGVPFFFQHGLGADVTQTFGLFRPPAGIRLIGFDCRAHGRTRPVGPEDKIRLGAFADDLVALMDYLNIQKAVVGGVSMGAAVALNLAIRYPGRVLGLVLQRPAWLDVPRRENAAVFGAIAGLIRRHGARQGLEMFKKSDLYLRAREVSAANAESLAAQFLHPRAEETVARLERIPLDSPCRDRAEWRGLKIPTLVLANGQDSIHPLDYGLTLAREIPNAQFKVLTPKFVSVERHNRQTQRFVEQFLLRHFQALTRKVLTP